MCEMSESDIFKKSAVLSSMIWRFSERCGAQAVRFVVELVLARILMPEDYGTVALITVFITVLQVFVDSGLGNALIQKKNADDLDFSTVFYTNVMFCTILYGIVFVGAPWISGFYGRPEMIPYIRVLGLTVLISGVKNVQQAYVSRNMLFKRFFFATLGGTIVAAVVGIAMAYGGYSVWALVAQQVVNLTIDTAILWLTVRWRPRLAFSLERLKGLFSFGWKLLVSALLETIYNNFRQLVVGKMYSSSDLAFYNQGEKFPKFIISNVNTSIDSVLLPAMSSVQDEREHVRQMTRRSITTSVYVMAPLMMGLAFTAEPLVRLVLTEKWLPCVPFMRIFCITYIFYPIHTANLNAIKALGRSDLFLKLEIIKKIMGLAVLFSTMWFGVMVMAYSLLFTSVCSQIINSWPNRKLLNYSYASQIRDILPGILLAVFMGFVITPVAWLGFPDAATLAVQVTLGAVVYIAGSAVLGLEEFRYLWGMLRRAAFIKKVGDKH